MAKLSDDDVACLRRRREQGELLRELAVEFGVTMATISKIARRDRWMHIS